MELVYFLGRFHVLALHLPIGILIAVVALEALARIPRYRHLAPAAPFLWGLAAATAVGTATLGSMHFAEGGFDGPAAFKHRLFGISVAVVTTAIWILRTKFQRVSAHVHVASGALILVLVTITGHYGGNLTHGDTYLVEHAPGFIRSMAGLAPARGRITDLAAANPYLDIVQPIFNERCAGCHNESKRRGGLSLASFASLTKGGKDGPVVAPGKPQSSDLVRRISLPHDDKDAMPAAGKTPLTADQVEIIRWWIAEGARADATLASAKLAPEMKSRLTRALGSGGANSAKSADPAESAARPDVKADAKTIDALVQAGFQVRPVSRSDPRLVVSGVGIRQIGSTQLQTLASAHAQIADLSLWQLGLRDADLEQLAGLTELRRLNLSGNQLSDAGVRRLAKMPKLEVLNLYGNEHITDESVGILAQLPALRKLYLWNTRIDAAQVRMLTERHSGLIVDLGDGKQITAP